MICSLIALLGLSACTSNPTQDRVATGALVGAAAGGIIGSTSGNLGAGALVGAGVGALGGYLYDKSKKSEEEAYYEGYNDGNRKQPRSLSQ
ncbi:MAG: glycine zipper domain-containing protein [Pseudomonadota bacterium]